MSNLVKSQWFPCFSSGSQCRITVVPGKIHCFSQWFQVKSLWFCPISSIWLAHFTFSLHSYRGLCSIDTYTISTANPLVEGSWSVVCIYVCIYVYMMRSGVLLNSSNLISHFLAIVCISLTIYISEKLIIIIYLPHEFSP